MGQFDEIGYDLRRGKTGIERRGETPKMVLQQPPCRVTSRKWSEKRESFCSLLEGKSARTRPL